MDFKRKIIKENSYSQYKKCNSICYIILQKDWGFCLAKNEIKNLNSKRYKVVIDSKFKKGNLKVGEIFLKGKTKFEILFSTYICHPSMANNELSGPAIQNNLIQYLSKLKNRNFSYRFVFLPETIGSIAYINKKLKNLKKM